MNKGSDQYLKIVEWSEEDGCYIGRCPGLMLGGVHGDDEMKVYKELCQVVEEWIAEAAEHGTRMPAPTAGKNYSGRFVLRIEPGLHEQLDIRASQEGDSLNSFCVKLLAGSIGVKPGKKKAATKKKARRR